jgi:hypothetical protein
MEERIQMASAGRKFWLELVGKYHIDYTCYVVVLPDENQDYHKAALKYLPQFMNKKHAKRAVVLAWDTNRMDFTNLIDERVQIVVCRRDEIASLVQFYSLYEFASNIVFASLELPSGRMGKGIIGHKNLTLDEVFAGVVYGLVDEEIS